jgi:enoyl-CoA hydratase
VVVQAEGPHFSAGEDLTPGAHEELLHNPLEPLPAQRLLADERRRARRWEYIVNFPRPTIAAVQGACIGAGFYLAMCCDLVIAAEDAVFADPSVRLGMVPALPSLLWLTGNKKVREILFFGRDIPAWEAEDLGLTTATVPLDRLAAETDRYARAIAASPADGLAFAKEAIAAVGEARGWGPGFRYTVESQLAAAGQIAAAADQGEFNFFQVRDERGLPAALTELRSRYAQT